MCVHVLHPTDVGDTCIVMLVSCKRNIKMDAVLLFTVAMQNVIAIPAQSVGASPSLASQVTIAEDQRPNFVFILLDDWGTGDVGAYQTLTNHGIDKVICCHVFTKIHDKNRHKARWKTRLYVCPS